MCSFIKFRELVNSQETIVIKNNLKITSNLFKSCNPAIPRGKIFSRVGKKCWFILENIKILNFNDREISQRKFLGNMVRVRVHSRFKGLKITTLLLKPYMLVAWQMTQTFLEVSLRRKSTLKFIGFYCTVNKKTHTHTLKSASFSGDIKPKRQRFYWRSDCLHSLLKKMPQIWWKSADSEKSYSISKIKGHGLLQTPLVLGLLNASYYARDL